MTHEEQRIYLIRELLNEDSQYKNLLIPEDEQGQKELLRALMNVRPPKPISKTFLDIQDQYLTWESAAAGIVDSASLPSAEIDHRLVLWRGDITTLKADAIVNAANSGMCGCFQPLHSCVDNMIHSKSGIALRLKCNDIMRRQGHEEPTGQAKITPAYNLPCKYVLHTVGPIVQGRLTKQHCDQLASCYRSCLELAASNGLKSIAFCCISTGVFRFPNDRAAKIAVRTVQEFLQQDMRIERVIFNVFKERDYEIYRGLLDASCQYASSAVSRS